MPEIFTGLRIGFSLTLIGTVLGEMFASQRGLGYLLMNAIGLHNVDVIMSVTFLLVVFAASVNGVAARHRPPAAFSRVAGADRLRYCIRRVSAIASGIQNISVESNAPSVIPRSASSGSSSPARRRSRQADSQASLVSVCATGPLQVVACRRALRRHRPDFGHPGMQKS